MTDLFLILFFIITLPIINYVLIKSNFFLDQNLSNIQKHKKLLLKKNQKTPLSGSFYFLIFLLLLCQEPENYNLFIATSCLIFLGMMADTSVLDSPNKRFFIQFILIFSFVYIDTNLIILLKIDFIDFFLENNLLRIFFVTFCLMILINGYNFIDGTNLLTSLNFLIVSYFLYSLIEIPSNFYLYNEIKTLIIILLIFTAFNSLGKNFLGDGGTYGISFFLGVAAILIVKLNPSISPYFIANLFWYPAFENLFTILRRSLNKKKNFKPDNYHLHQLIFLSLSVKSKILKSSMTGALINLYLFFILVLCFKDYSNTKYQVLFLFINSLIYLIVYYILSKKSKINTI